MAERLRQNHGAAPRDARGQADRDADFRRRAARACSRRRGSLLRACPHRRGSPECNARTRPAVIVRAKLRLRRLSERETSEAVSLCERGLLFSPDVIERLNGVEVDFESDGMIPPGGICAHRAWRLTPASSELVERVTGY